MSCGPRSLRSALRSRTMDGSRSKPAILSLVSGNSGTNNTRVRRIEQQFGDWHYSPLTDTSPEIITIASKAEIDR